MVVSHIKKKNAFSLVKGKFLEEGTAKFSGVVSQHAAGWGGGATPSANGDQGGALRMCPTNTSNPRNCAIPLLPTACSLCLTHG